MSCNLDNLSVIDTVFVCLSSLCPVLILVNPISELIILRVPSLTLVTSKSLVIRPGPVSLTLVTSKSLVNRWSCRTQIVL